MPWTLALHCDVAFKATVDGLQDAETEETAEGTGLDWLPEEPPQPANAARTKQGKKTYER